MRAATRFGGAFSGLVLAACSLFGSVDDLEGNGPTDSGTDSSSSGGSSSSCQAASGCLGCESCAAYCECTKPFAVEACVAECEDGGGGSSGASGGGGSAGSAGSAASAGSAGSAGSNCDDDKYVGQSCADTDTTSACGNCLAMDCCVEIDECFQNDSCAQAYACWENECPNPDPNCALSECSPCIGSALSQLSAFSNCAQEACATDCNATP